MILSLMLQVWEEVKGKGIQKGDERLGESLVKGLKDHSTKLAEHQAKFKEDLATEEKERNKKITSEDLHEGWDSKVCYSIPLNMNSK